jgi:hypothetical protein
VKEPGQLAYEATPAVLTWEQQPESAKALWAITEAAIRADERAKVIEECAKVAEGHIDPDDDNDRETQIENYQCRELATAIRALGEKPNPQTKKPPAD